MSGPGRGGGMGFLATVAEGVAVAFDSLGANKVRSGLTILGVMIGVMVVMVMAAVITGINHSFREIMAPDGVSTFYVMHFDFTTMGTPDPLSEEEPDFFRNPPLEIEHARELARIPGIQSVSPMADLADGGYRAAVGGDEVEIALYAVGADYVDISGGDMIEGRWFTSSEADRRAGVVVIDSTVAVDLFGQRDPVGRDIRIHRGREMTQVRVIGIFRPPANLFAGLATHWVLLPFPTADKELSIWDRMVSFMVRPDPDMELEVALDATRARLRQLRGVQPGEDDNFALLTPAQMVNLFEQVTGVLFAAMVGLSSIGLLVGGVGVIGIMMISVTERTREIGLRKAMGGRRRDIMWQFLVEAATLTLLGGATGMLVGGGMVLLINQLTPLTAVVPVWSIISALLASALTGVGFGLYPASRAAALDPIDALRYE